MRLFKYGAHGHVRNNINAKAIAVLKDNGKIVSLDEYLKDMASSDDIATDDEIDSLFAGGDPSGSGSLSDGGGGFGPDANNGNWIKLLSDGEVQLGAHASFNGWDAEGGIWIFDADNNRVYYDDVRILDLREKQSSVYDEVIWVKANSGYDYSWPYIVFYIPAGAVIDSWSSAESFAPNNGNYLLLYNEGEPEPQPAVEVGSAYDGTAITPTGEEGQYVFNDTPEIYVIDDGTFILIGWNTTNVDIDVDTIIIHRPDGFDIDIETVTTPAAWYTV